MLSITTSLTSCFAATSSNYHFHYHPISSSKTYWANENCCWYINVIIMTRSRPKKLLNEWIILWLLSLIQKNGLVYVHTSHTKQTTGMPVIVIVCSCDSFSLFSASQISGVRVVSRRCFHATSALLSPETDRVTPHGIHEYMLLLKVTCLVFFRRFKITRYANYHYALMYNRWSSSTVC